MIKFLCAWRAGSKRDDLGVVLGDGLELGWGLLAELLKANKKGVFKTRCIVDQSPEVARFA